MILHSIINSLDHVLTRITASHLLRYDALEKRLLDTDVSADRDYQRIFNGYYRMQRRPSDWYKCFFKVLEREKRNQSVSFQKVFEELYGKTGRVEPSFASKLVATTRPELPVYDRHVRENLELIVPPQNIAPAARVEQYLRTYGQLLAKFQALVKAQEFEALRAAFDSRFPAHKHFTDVKKLDLLLWQFRLNETA